MEDEPIDANILTIARIGTNGQYTAIKNKKTNTWELSGFDKTFKNDEFEQLLNFVDIHEKLKHI